jgi:WD40 repeat protein
MYLGSLDSSETKRLTAADTQGTYMPPGWVLYVRQNSLVGHRFDLASGELAGEPVIIADGVSGFSVSAAGPVAYRSGGATNRRQLTWFDRSGKTLGTFGRADENSLVDFNLSPDGRRVAADRRVEGNSDIWLLDGTRTTRFTFDEANDTFPIWSPDGGSIVFTAQRKNPGDLYQRPSSGAGTEEVVLESPQPKVPSDWSPDGRFLINVISEETTASPITILQNWTPPAK